MRILLIGDPHLQMSKFTQSIQLLRWIESVVNDVRPDLVVNLGDTFHNHSNIRAEIQSEFVEHVINVSSRSSYVYVLGNHDFYKPNDSKYHALTPFKHIKADFEVYDSVSHVDNLSFVPYHPDHTKFPKDLKNICIAHQTFVGADYGYYRPDVGVDADKLDCELIISGHIHKRQTFGKVFYPGSPISDGTDDIDQVKGLVLLDTNTYKQTFIESPFPKWRGLKIDLNECNDLSSDIAQHINNQDHWVIEITGTRSSIAAAIESKDWQQLINDYRISVKPVYIDKDKQAKTIISATTIDSIFDEYVDKIYQGNVDKELLKRKAHELFQ
jgi:DNA repair exonuclease SbcCD nuclease subunit